MSVAILVRPTAPRALPPNGALRPEAEGEASAPSRRQIERSVMPVALLKFGFVVGVWGLLTPLAALFRLEGDVAAVLPGLVVLTAVGLALKALAVYVAGLHRRSWRRAGVSDLLAIAGAVVAVTVGQLALVFGETAFLVVPRSLPLIEGPLAVLAIGGAAFLRRLVHEHVRRGGARETTRRVLVVGAGEAGLLAVRDMRRNRDTGMAPVGFLDDDPYKRRQRHGGLPVFGSLDDLPAVVRREGVDDVLVAMPSQRGRTVRRVLELAREAGVPARSLPALHELASGRVAVSPFREVRIEDLLGRPPVRLEREPIAAYLRGKRVLVTGAGGSIGSEVVRQVAAFGPAELILLGRGENSVFEIDRELAQSHPDVARHAVICDVRDEVSLARVFRRHRPEVVFHAAAHKHVPLMESNPEQAVLNNILGTRNVAALALEHGVTRFVNISSDKAVNPTSVMGASKRVAEAVVTEAGRTCAPGGAFVSVRFGNVLGSRGSVIPVFKDQIRRGGPVMVTDPDMIRYFMTIPEASQLVLQAGALAENGRVYVLDMGDPVRIVDLARDLILLSGLEPGKDIEIAFSGTRRGEKLYEELLTAEEGTEASRHEKIFMAQTAPLHVNLGRQLERLAAAAHARDGGEVRALLQELVPLYHPTPGTSSDGVMSAVVLGERAMGDGASGDGAALPVPVLAARRSGGRTAAHERHPGCISEGVSAPAA